MADTRVLGGNLCLAFPHKLVLIPEITHLFPHWEPQCLIVWDATASPLPAPNLLLWAKSQTTIDLIHSQPQFFTATYQYHHSRPLRLGMLQIY